MSEENKGKLTLKIKKEIIDKLIAIPQTFDYRNEFKLQDKSSYNPYLELNYAGKTEMGCYFKKQLTPEGGLGLASLKNFSLTDYNVEPDHDELHFREYEYENEQRIAVRYHFTLKRKDKNVKEEEFGIFVCVDWGKDTTNKITRVDIFCLMQHEGDALLNPKYTNTIVEFSNHILKTLDVKTTCDDCVHRFAYQLSGVCDKVHEQEL